jgi:hypothetical protein
MFRLISIKEVVAKSILDLGLDSMIEIPYQNIIEWIASGMSYIGVYTFLETKVATLDVENYRASLPCDYHSSLSFLDESYYYNYNPDLIIESVDDLNFTKITNYDFNITGTYITTSYRHAKIRVKYLAFPVDDCGIPLIPDLEPLKEALVWRVAKYLVLSGKLPNKGLSFSDCDIMWNRYLGQAKGELNYPTIEEQSRLANMWTSIYPYKDGFVNLIKNF